MDFADLVLAEVSLRRVLGEPLLHFLALGALLFVSYAWVHGGGTGTADEIVVSSGQVKSLRAQFMRVWQRPPTRQEMDAQIDAWVREEVLYREGIALALDRDDPVVRRRVAQKMAFIADGHRRPRRATRNSKPGWTHTPPNIAWSRGIRFARSTSIRPSMATGSPSKS